MDKQTEQKKLAGEYAAELVEDGMTVGLGTGSTVRFFVERLAQRVYQEGLHIVGVTTSSKTSALAKSLGLRILSVDEVDEIDLTIDGADEVDEQLNGIKGGGAALLFEKIVAMNSKQNIWIVDGSKYHEHLGSFPLPVEVVPYGSRQLRDRFEAAGYKPTFRLREDGHKLNTDAGNYIIDLHLDYIERPEALATRLEQTVGVVEHGLFLGMTDKVIIGGDEIRVVERPGVTQ